MRLTQPLLSAALLLGLATPALGQLRASRPARPVQHLPRLFVATPFVNSAADSTAAVRVGDGLRKRMENVAGKWYQVVTREQMNEALIQYAYPPDAILATQVAKTLGNTLQARAMVSGTMTRADNNRFSAVIRVIGMNDKAGYVVSGAQAPNQSLEEFGSALASRLSDAFKAQQDAKECWDNQSAKPDKALAAAQDALKTLPNHGLAEYCIASIFLSQKKTDSAVVHLKRATEGDPLSLEAWTDLAIQYEAAHDSAATLEAFKQMLRVAPTNQALRDNAFKLFLGYNRPEEARNVADEGISIDPTNPDWYDLKSNACLFASDFACAVQALEEVYSLDPEKADTTFYQKIAFAASMQPDTARLLLWAQRGTAKYPTNGALLDFLVKGYALAGPVDSLVAATRRYVAIDSSDVTPVVRAIQGLVEEARYDDAFALYDIVDRQGSPEDKTNVAVIVLQKVPALAQQETADYPLMARLTRRIVTMTDNAQVVQQAQFWRGYGVWRLVVANDERIRQEKSCTLVQESVAMADEAQAALQAGRATSEEFAASTLGTIATYRPTLAAMKKAFCK